MSFPGLERGSYTALVLHSPRIQITMINKGGTSNRKVDFRSRSIKYKRDCSYFINMQGDVS